MASTERSFCRPLKAPPLNTLAPALHEAYLQYLPVGRLAFARELCAAVDDAVSGPIRDFHLDQLAIRSSALSAGMVPAFAAVRDILEVNREEFIGTVGGPIPPHAGRVFDTFARGAPFLVWPHSSPMAPVVSAWLEQAMQLVANGQEFGDVATWVLLPAVNIDAGLPRDEVVPADVAAAMSTAARTLAAYGVIGIRREFITCSLQELLLRLTDVQTSPLVSVSYTAGGYDNENRRHLTFVRRADLSDGTTLRVDGDRIGDARFDTVALFASRQTSRDGAVDVVCDLPVLAAEHALVPPDVTLIRPIKGSSRVAFNRTLHFNVRTSVDLTMCDPNCVVAPVAFAHSGVQRLDLSPLHSLNQLGSEAFDHCSLNAIVLPRACDSTVCDSSLFSGSCGALAMAPAWWLRELPGAAFRFAAGVTTLDMSQHTHLEAIGRRAFASAMCLTHVTMPPRLRVLDAEAFDSCAALVSIDFSPCPVDSAKGVTISDRAFHGCDALPALHIPASVVEIGESAFARCGHLTSVDLSCARRLRAIAQSAFCASPIQLLDLSQTAVRSVPTRAAPRNMGQLVVGPQVNSIADSAFIELRQSFTLTCPSPCPLKTIGKGLFMESHVSKVDLSTVTSMTRVPTRAFALCSSLVAVELPTTVDTIGESAFEGCSAFNAVPLLKALKHIRVIEESAFLGTRTTSFVIMPELEELNASAFASCSMLTSVTVHPRGNDKLKYIRLRAFADCPRLAKADVSLLRAGYQTGDAAFKNCHRLSDVRLPPSMTKLLSSCFAGCTQLTSIDVSALTGLRVLGPGTFAKSGLTSLDVSACKELGSLGAGAFELCQHMKQLTVHNELDLPPRMQLGLTETVDICVVGKGGKAVAVAPSKNAWSKGPPSGRTSTGIKTSLRR